MPLVRPGSEALDAPLSEAHGRARKIDPTLSEGDLVRVAGGRNQAEAELIQGLLLEWGVPSILRRTAGFDVPDFLAAGPRDVLVAESGLETARAVLLQSEIIDEPASGPGASGRRISPAVMLMLALLAGSGVLALLIWLVVTINS